MNNKKVFIALALVVLLGVVGGTYAYFTSSAILTNEFTTGTYETKIVETFESPDNWTPGTTTDKKVNVVNKGTVDVAVRAKIEETWTAADGTSLPTVRDDVQIAQYIIGYNWILAEDGYYYYKDVLETGETSSDFISSVTFNPNFTLKDGEDIKCTTTTTEIGTTVDCVNLDSGYAGAKYILNITLETIQADQSWNYIAVDKLFYWGLGSITLASVEDVTLQTGAEQSMTTSLAKISNSVYEIDEVVGIQVTNVHDTGRVYVLGTYVLEDILYSTENYYYINTDFTGPFFVILNEFGELTPGVWMVSDNNPIWDSLESISSYGGQYIVSQ